MNLASEVLVLTPIKKRAAKWREIFGIALDDLAHLVSPKKIVYCEGRDRPGAKGKENGLDAKVYNRIFAEKYHDVLFVSSGGNSELDQRSEIGIAILSKIFPTIEILVLKDRDISSGKLTTAQDRLIYLANQPGNHRVLRRWELENYLFDKEVLSKYCAGNQLVFHEADYDRFVTDISDANLKDNIGYIKNFCGINTSISAEYFKLSLSEVISEDMAVYKELERCIFV